MKKTKTYLLAAAMVTASCYLASCSSDGGNGGSGTITPGTTVSGAAGCTLEQKTSMESMPGMNNIVSTTMDAAGNLIYSDATGNRCTMDKEGNMKLVCTNGDTAYRDKTIREPLVTTGSPVPMHTILEGTVLTGTYSDDIMEIINGGAQDIISLFSQFPEAPAKKTTEGIVTESFTAEYDSISITYLNTSCYTSKMHITKTTAYDNVYTTYTATDGFFYQNDQKFHLVIEGDKAYVNFVDEMGNEYEASPRVSVTAKLVSSSIYNSSKSSYVKSPTTSIYYNYTINKDGDITMTNATDRMVLEKDGYEYETTDKAHIKLYVLGGKKNDDDIEIAPPSPVIK